MLNSEQDSVLTSEHWLGIPFPGWYWLSSVHLVMPSLWKVLTLTSHPGTRGCWFLELPTSLQAPLPSCWGFLVLTRIRMEDDCTSHPPERPRIFYTWGWWIHFMPVSFLPVYGHYSVTVLHVKTSLVDHQHLQGNAITNLLRIGRSTTIFFLGNFSSEPWSDVWGILYQLFFLVFHF